LRIDRGSQKPLSFRSVVRGLHLVGSESEVPVGRPDAVVEADPRIALGVRVVRDGDDLPSPPSRRRGDLPRDEVRHAFISFSEHVYGHHLKIR
jgi:hypothetical protein